MDAPLFWKDMTLNYEEVFRSAGRHSTEKEAWDVVDKIRRSHSERDGWLELGAWVEATPEGYVAVRHHAQYK